MSVPHLGAGNAICPVTDLNENECRHCLDARIGLFGGIPDSEYHADRASLSSSGARTLLPPSCPAIFVYERDHGGRAPKKEYDIGHAVHKFVLGEGAEIVSIAKPDWRTKEAREQRDTAYKVGKIPLLSWQVAEAREIANRVHQHPLAGALFTDGLAEQSGWWRDPDSGVFCRFRPDWMTWRCDDHLVLVDVKTTDKSSPDGFAKSVTDYGYHLQEQWYRDGARMLFPDVERISFLFVTVSKQKPYLVNVCQLDETAQRIGAHLAAQARDIYAECVATDHWPDYGIGPHLISLPYWATRPYEEILQ